MSGSYDLITIGDMCVDLVLSGADIVPEFGQVEKLVDGYLLEMGGSCCIFACQAAKLGLRVAIMGVVGQDSLGDLMISRLREAGVDTRFVLVDPGLKTGLGIALATPDDRAILTYLGSANAVRPQDVSDDWLRLGRHFHYGSYFLQTRLRPAVPQVLGRAQHLGLTTSLDTNWDPEDVWRGLMPDVLRHVDVFFPNLQEALRISGQPDLESAVAALSGHVPLLVVKRGADGATAVRDGEAFSCPVARASVVDDIGAGDSFDAGFLAAWMGGLSIDQALRIGCACGRAVVGAAGGIAGQPWARSRTELLRLIDAD